MLCKVKDDGTFVDVQTIGRFCYEDDELVFQQGLHYVPRLQPYKEQTINSLKHRFLVHLYKKAVCEEEVSIDTVIHLLKTKLQLQEFRNSIF